MMNTIGYVGNKGMFPGIVDLLSNAYGSFQ